MDSELNFELLKEIVEKVELKDVLLIASVPVIAGIVFLLPSSIQEMLALNYKDPNPITLFTKVFVHSGVDHLSNNLVAYVFFVVPSLVMTALVQQKRKFYLFFFFFVLVFPFVLSPLNLYYINAETGRGLSGVVSALLGFMPVSVYLFLKEKISDNLNVSFSLSVVTFALGAIAFLYVDVLLQKVLSLVVIYSLGCIFLWFSVREVEFSGLKELLKENVPLQNYLFLSAVTVLIFLFSVPLLFPIKFVRSGGFVNVLAHYFGFAMGFFVPYFAISIEEAIKGYDFETKFWKS